MLLYKKKKKKKTLLMAAMSSFILFFFTVRASRLPQDLVRCLMDYFKALDYIMD